MFARWLFKGAGVYGLLMVAPLFLLEAHLGELFPPRPNHPELYYGFAGTAFAWQLMYLLIGSDPVRYRPAMPIGALGKTIFGVSSIALFAAGRLGAANVA